jgi:hypothetical protein
VGDGDAAGVGRRGAHWEGLAGETKTAQGRFQANTTCDP